MESHLNQKRFPFKLDVDRVPYSKDLYLECCRCGDISSSLPDDDTWCCKCSNILLDSGRIGIKYPKKIRAFAYSPRVIKELTPRASLSPFLFTFLLLSLSLFALAMVFAGLLILTFNAA